MAELYSQYESGLQFTAGTIAGSVLGTSGLNPIVDRLNSISNDNGLVIGSVVSGTSLEIYASGGFIGSPNYLNIPGINFSPRDIGSGWTARLAFGATRAIRSCDPGSTYFVAGVNLPDRAIVTGLLASGTAGMGSIWLYRADTSSSFTTLASSDNGVEDTTIGNATIDNTKNYILKSSMLASGQSIEFARISFI